MDLRPPLDPFFRDLGLPVIVTPPGGTPVSTTGFWVPTDPLEAPLGSDARVADLQRVLALRRDEATSVPHGSVVQVAEQAGGTVKSWRVDGFGPVLDVEILEVVLVPA